MTSAIWSFLLGWAALSWGMASIYLPVRVAETLNGLETDPSRAVVAIVPVAVMTLVVGWLTRSALKRVETSSGWETGVSRGLGFSGLALSVIGLFVAALFSPIWGGF
ncbi:hypothetical protein QFW77_17035 [Luteimonas sp. RD2P54]|uniref:MFS transporter n=1 Tax=Luteimonas endophytica TaxID=3042023 RepID=A0ABT6JEP9_9GAMM|nr:hypothetical protein [Luteimonas endophytica]MDH5824678.1 hypothetical protein [Luteimonas endophytica]